MNELSTDNVLVIDSVPEPRILKASYSIDAEDFADCTEYPDPDNRRIRYGNNRYHQPAAVKRKRAKIAAISRRRNRK